MEDFSKRNWWRYLDPIQQDLIKQSQYLIEEERKNSRLHTDYSFVVFPAAKAYEGFLKKLFFDLGLISRSQFSGERFRIGRALNPAIYKEYPQESVYERLTRFCGGEAISAKLWKTWKNSRNLVFHFFPEKENLISFPEAQKRVAEIIEAIDFSFKGCQVAQSTQIFKKNTLRYCSIFFAYVFTVWSIFRFAFRFPISGEELVIKPFLWLLPLFFSIKLVEKRPLLSSLGFSGKNFQNSILIILGFLFFFALESLTVGYWRHKGLFPGFLFSLPLGDFMQILVLAATALVEETLFRGYLFNRLWEVLGKAWKANLLVTLGFVLIHLPISIFVYHLSFSQISLSFVLLLVMSLGSGLLFTLTYNTIPSVIWHFLWNWQVILGI